MTTIISVLHEGPTDAAGALKEKLAPVLNVIEFAAVVMGVADPVGELTHEIMRLLDSPLGTIIDTVWSDHLDVRAAIDRTRHQPGETVRVPLAHERVTISDRLKVDVNGKEETLLEPTLTITLDVRALTVLVCNGGITQVGTLDADVTATLALGQRELLSGKTRPLELPGFPWPAPADHGRPSVNA